MPTRIYVQAENVPDIKLLEIDDQATIEDLKLAVQALFNQVANPSVLTLSVEDDDNDALGHATHVKHLKKDHGIRLHLHRCKHIAVQVRFGSEEVMHDFRPATTIGRVRQWAGHKLGMKPEDIAEHVLQVAGTSEQPDVDIHIGTLSKGHQCSVIFDFVPAHRING